MKFDKIMKIFRDNSMNRIVDAKVVYRDIKKLKTYFPETEKYWEFISCLENNGFIRDIFDMITVKFELTEKTMKLISVKSKTHSIKNISEPIFT